MTEIPRPLIKRLSGKMIIHDIDEECRRRKHSQKKHYVEITPPKGRHGGKQDLTDIDPRTPWQQTYLDQTGKVLPVNTNWVCPKCGKEYCSSFPPDKCFVCGLESPLYDKKKVNFKK